MRVDIIENAVIVPPGSGQQRPRSGVFDADGQFVPTSATVLSHGKAPPPPKWAAPQAAIEGTHLYAGLGRRHFGHYLLESATRFWALPAHPAQGVMYADRPGPPKWLGKGPKAELHALLSGDLPSALIRVPTLVERLIVPAQGFGHGALITGTAPFLGHVRPLLQRFETGESPRLYISRARLQPHQQVHRELEIEERLEAAGYGILRPERVSLAEQCSAYRTAKVILGGDGSAFHLAAMVMRPEAKVGIILRRNRPEMLTRLATQIEGFAGVRTEGFDLREPIRVQKRWGTYKTAAPVPLRHERLFADLREAGFL